MKLNENIVEYYEELYPVSDSVKEFYAREALEYSKPVKYLSVGCGTGSFEYFLSKNGADVTGLEVENSFLESANRKKCSQLLSMRFFQMTPFEMGQYLGKKFYNIISILNDRILFFHDSVLMERFFCDCRQLLSDGGKLIISLPNFMKFQFHGECRIQLPVRESMRARLFSLFFSDGSGTYYIKQNLETGNGKILSIVDGSKIFPLTKNHIEIFAAQSGFQTIHFYSDFSAREFTEDSDSLVAVLE